MTGTVQNQLSTGEAFEFGAAVMQQLGRDIDPDKARYYITHKKQLGDDLRKLSIHKMTEFDIAGGTAFYAQHFGVEADFSSLHVPPKPDYACRPVVIVPGITNNQVFDACIKAFKSWRYYSDFDTTRDIVKRPDGPYVVWVRDMVEADDDMKNKSAIDIERACINTLTLKERLVMELAYFNETGNHLDVENWTLCAGSRRSDGVVPFVRWYDARFFVRWTAVDYRNPDLRARVTVS